MNSQIDAYTRWNNTLASDVNNAGQVVGKGYIETINPANGQVVSRVLSGFMYNNGTMTAFGTGFTDDQLRNQKINNIGEVLLQGPNGSLIYSNGTMTELGFGGAKFINDLGQIAGDNNGPFLYTNGQMNQIVDRWDYHAQGLNNEGDLLYNMHWQQWGYHVHGGYVRSGTGAIADLSNWVNAPMLINDNRQIVGYMNSTTGWQGNAFLLTPDLQPVPIPGAVCLLGSGLVGLMGFRKRLTT